MNNAVKLQVIAGSGQATADLLEEHADRLKAIDSDVRAELRQLNSGLSTERRIGDDRFTTLGAKVEVLGGKVDSLQDDVRGLRDELRILMKAINAQGKR